MKLCKVLYSKRYILFSDSAVAFSGEGYKAEQCATALEKLKAYLSGIGYN